MCRNNFTKSRNLGFTLIELVIVLVVVALLALAAYPSYVNRIHKSKRLDGKGALLQVELTQEKWRNNHVSYTDVLGAGGLELSNTSADGYYNVAIAGGSANATGFVASATGIGSQAEDTEGSTSCTTLTLTVSPSGTSRTPAECW